MIPLSDIIVRSIIGYVFIVPILILYFLYLKKIGKGQRPLHIAAVFLFCYYIFGVLTVTGIGYTRLRHFSPSFALIPFIDMIRGPIDTALNVVLFVPFGFLLPLLYSKYHNMGSVALGGFLFSLSVELVQMFDWGSTDINDLITNTAGACIGYLLSRLLLRGLNEGIKLKFKAFKVNDAVEVLIFTVCAFVVMALVQPLVIHELM